MAERDGNRSDKKHNEQDDSAMHRGQHICFDIEHVLLRVAGSDPKGDDLANKLKRRAWELDCPDGICPDCELWVLAWLLLKPFDEVVETLVACIRVDGNEKTAEDSAICEGVFAHPCLLFLVTKQQEGSAFAVREEGLPANAKQRIERIVEAVDTDKYIHELRSVFQKALRESLTEEFAEEWRNTKATWWEFPISLVERAENGEPLAVEKLRREMIKRERATADQPDFTCEDRKETHREMEEILKLCLSLQIKLRSFQVNWGSLPGGVDRPLRSLFFVFPWEPDVARAVDPVDLSEDLWDLIDKMRGTPVYRLSKTRDTSETPSKQVRQNVWGADEIANVLRCPSERWLRDRLETLSDRDYSDLCEKAAEMKLSKCGGRWRLEPDYDSDLFHFLADDVPPRD